MNNNLENAATIASRFINNTNRNIFLTGKAGTGKTTFLRSIVAHTYKNTIVAAPTGIAAINAGGITLHSLFQLPFGAFIPSNKLPATPIDFQLNTPDSLLKGLQMHASKRKLIQEMELLIIDEVSMLRADLLDAIDVTMRSVRKNKYEPFGGVQILFIGDLFQLPPVVKPNEWECLKLYYNDIYFFSAHALQKQQPLYIELEKIYRQSDHTFITLLNHLRENQVTRSDVEVLNNHYDPDFELDSTDGYIHLTTHNRKADTINREALKELPGELFTYDAVIEKDFNEFLFPVEYTLELKEGAQVMFIKNDYSGEQRYFNGKIGVVSALSEEDIEVTFPGGEATLVERYTWENKKFSLSEDTNEIEERVVGTFSQYPIKLAWAITVHKSQGLTFEKAIIDVSSAFAPGQIYVALSRLVSLDGLILSAPIYYGGPEQDDSLKAYTQHNETEPLLETVLQEEIRQFIREISLKSFNFNGLLTKLHFFTESHDKDEKRSAKQQQKNWALQLEADFKLLAETADKFSGQLKGILRSPDDHYLALLKSRLEAAKGYFEPRIGDCSARIFQQIRAVEKEKKMKAYTAELKDLERLFFKQLQILYKAEELVRSAMSNKEFSKDDLLKTALYQDRAIQLEKNATATEKPKRKKEQSADHPAKKDKRKSNEISFLMFNKGKSIIEIASERGYTVATIEGHLVPYVAKGLIPIDRLVDQEKVDRVVAMAKELGTLSLSPLKERLGSDVTYSELRFIMAHRFFQSEE